MLAAMTVIAIAGTVPAAARRLADRRASRLHQHTLETIGRLAGHRSREHTGSIPDTDAARVHVRVISRPGRLPPSPRFRRADKDGPDRSCLSVRTSTDRMTDKYVLGGKWERLDRTMMPQRVVAAGRRDQAV
jgi:hypothetical protein